MFMTRDVKRANTEEEADHLLHTATPQLSFPGQFFTSLQFTRGICSAYLLVAYIFWHSATASNQSTTALVAQW